MMYLALTYDHRLLDGREAVTFLVKIKQYIEVSDLGSILRVVADCCVFLGPSTHVVGIIYIAQQEQGFPSTGCSVV